MLNGPALGVIEIGKQVHSGSKASMSDPALYRAAAVNAKQPPEVFISPY